MKLSGFNNKGFAPIVLVLLLLFGIAAGTILIQNGVNFLPKAEEFACTEAQIQACKNLKPSQDCKKSTAGPGNDYYCVPRQTTTGNAQQTGSTQSGSDPYRCDEIDKGICAAKTDGKTDCTKTTGIYECIKPAPPNAEDPAVPAAEEPATNPDPGTAPAPVVTTDKRNCENVTGGAKWCANRWGKGSDCLGGNGGPFGDGCSEPPDVKCSSPAGVIGSSFYKCAQQNGSCPAGTGVGVPASCYEDGGWHVTNSRGECVQECYVAPAPAPGGEPAAVPAVTKVIPPGTAGTGTPKTGATAGGPAAAGAGSKTGTASTGCEEFKDGNDLGIPCYKIGVFTPEDLKATEADAKIALTRYDQFNQILSDVKGKINSEIEAKAREKLAAAQAKANACIPK